MKQENDKKIHVNERQLVVFSLADEEFGVEIKKVNSIIKMEKITKIPNADFFVEGVINLRGKIIVVVNLHKKLGLTEKGQDKDTRIIVVELEEETIGMVVDAVKEVLRIEESRIEEAPQIILEKIDSDYIEGVGILNERLIVLLDVNKILHKSDLDKIKNIEEKTTNTSASDNSPSQINNDNNNSNKDTKAENISPENYFWFNNGKAVKNMNELVEDLKNIDDNTFCHHVNSEKNDFAEWIKNVLKNEELSAKLKSKTSKEEIISVLNNSKIN